MIKTLAQAEYRLRTGMAYDPAAQPLSRLLGCVVIGGMIYGAAMGSYGGVLGLGSLQAFYSAVKVPLLLTVSFALALPSFFVLNTLLGLRSDFGRVLRSLVATQAVLALLLASLAPYTIFWYVAFFDYASSKFVNLLTFALASVTAQLILRRAYRPLIARNAAHWYMMWAWLIIYAFIGVQMAWVLRPFIGAPHAPVQFFRDDPWSNAYVIVARLIWRVLTS